MNYPLTICQGCDTELGASRFCGNCEETMPTYEWNPADYARSPSRIETLLASEWRTTVAVRVIQALAIAVGERDGRCDQPMKKRA